MGHVKYLLKQRYQTSIALEAFNYFDLLGREFEIKYFEIGFNTLLSYRLGYNNVIPLNLIAYQNLSGCLVFGSSNFLDLEDFRGCSVSSFS